MEMFSRAARDTPLVKARFLSSFSLLLSYSISATDLFRGDVEPGGDTNVFSESSVGRFSQRAVEKFGAEIFTIFMDFYLERGFFKLQACIIWWESKLLIYVNVHFNSRLRILISDSIKKSMLTINFYF